MKDITIKTDINESLVVGRNGVHKLAAIKIWQSENGKLFIDGIGVSTRTLNAGFIISQKSAEKLITAIKNS